MTENGPEIVKNETPSGGVDRWFRDRIESCDLFDGLTAFERHVSRTEGGPSLWDLIGKAMWVTFALVVISGIGLMGGYSPTTSGSFISVENIQTSYPLGWWLRGVHKWGCDLFLMLALLRILRIAVRRAYKAGGEFTWLGSFGILFLAWIGGLTGYLLIWNQRVFEAGDMQALTTEGASEFEKLYPLGGLGLSGWFSQVLLGGLEMSQAGLSAYYTLHIACGMIILLLALFWRTMSRAKFPSHRNFDLKIPPALFWTVVGALSLLALVLPPPLGSAVDTILKPHPALSDWYYHDFYQLVESLGPTVGCTVFALGLFIAIFLPWIDRAPPGRPRAGVNGLIIGWFATTSILISKAFGWEIPDPAMFILIALVWIFILGFVIAIEKNGFLKPKSEISGEVEDI